MEKQEIAQVVQTVLRVLDSRGMLVEPASTDKQNRPKNSIENKTGSDESADLNFGQVLTAEKLEDFTDGSEKNELCVPPGTIVTAAAREQAETMGVEMT